MHACIYWTHSILFVSINPKVFVIGVTPNDVKHLVLNHFVLKHLVLKHLVLKHFVLKHFVCSL